MAKASSSSVIITSSLASDTIVSLFAFVLLPLAITAASESHVPELGSSRVVFQERRVEAEKKIAGEFSDVKHFRGIMSMGRYEDTSSAQSSFSILLGNASHLDGQYDIFGKVTKGDETLIKLEELPTHREGIFVMPTERITILSSYYYDTKMEVCEEENSKLRTRLAASAIEIERQRMKCFP